MMEDSYDFDPCILDDLEVDIGAAFEGLDSWKPKTKIKRLMISKWREDYNEGKINSAPSADDVNKIKMYLKKGYADAEILNAFGISSDTLIAIKNDCYSPSEGIMRTLDGVYKEVINIKEDVDKNRRKTEKEMERRVLKMTNAPHIKKLHQNSVQINKIITAMQMLRDIMINDKEVFDQFNRKLGVKK